MNEFFAHLYAYDINIRSRVRRLRIKLDLCETAPKLLSPEEMQKLASLMEPVQREALRLERLHALFQEDLIDLHNEDMIRQQKRLAEPLYTPKRPILDMVMSEAADSESTAEVTVDTGSPESAEKARMTLEDAVRKQLQRWVARGSLDDPKSSDLI